MSRATRGSPPKLAFTLRYCPSGALRAHLQNIVFCIMTARRFAPHYETKQIILYNLGRAQCFALPGGVSAFTSKIILTSALQCARMKPQNEQKKHTTNELGCKPLSGMLLFYFLLNTSAIA